jgi:serine/threonine protein kinase
VKLLKADQTQTSTGIRGTRGYFAPEWFKNVGISSKVDVYSFGIVLLEIVCCRRNVDLKATNEEQVILTYWAYDCYRGDCLDLLVEGDEEASIDMKMVERFTRVALWCVQDEPAMRPTMLKVTKMLDGAIGVPQPPINTPPFLSSLL